MEKCTFTSLIGWYDEYIWIVWLQMYNLVFFRNKIKHMEIIFFKHKQWYPSLASNRYIQIRNGWNQNNALATHLSSPALWLDVTSFSETGTNTTTQLELWNFYDIKFFWVHHLLALCNFNFFISQIKFGNSIFDKSCYFLKIKVGQWCTKASSSEIYPYYSNFGKILEVYLIWSFDLCTHIYIVTVQSVQG